MALKIPATIVGLSLLGLSTAHAAPNDGPVKIGLLTDMSSVLSDTSGTGSLAALRLAVAEFGGSVLGKPIEVVSADHQSKADIGASIARKWYDQDGVDMIADVPNSAVALATLEVSRNAHRIVMFSGPATSEITGPRCSPYATQWMYDTYSLAHGTASAIVKNGGTSWFFITADYAFGHSMTDDMTNVIDADGGKVLGNALAAFGTTDYSSFLLQAQASKAKIVGVSTGGADTINVLKQASEFGVAQGGQKLASGVVFLTDVHSLGLQIAQGLEFTSPFYWDQSDVTRAWSKKFFDQTKRMPTSDQAGVYSSVLHYLQAVQAVGSKDPDRVMAKMREMPINDATTHAGKLRIDGRVVRDMYLFEAKTPSESKGEWDLYKQLGVVPGAEATRPLDQGGCPLVKN